MNTNLYQEAIAEAKKLREIAEQNAKNKIVEAVTPRIRRLIEQEIGGDYEELSDDDWSEDGAADLTASDSDDSMSVPEPSLEDVAPLAAEPSEQPEELDLETELPGVDVSHEEKDGRVTLNITVEGDDAEDDEEDDSSEKLEEISRRALNRLNEQRYRASFKKAKSLVMELKRTRSSSRRKKLLKELASLRSALILNTDNASVSLAMKINNLLKENGTMSRRTRRNRRLNENAWWLREGEEEELDLGDESGEETEAGSDEDVDVDAITMAVEDLVSALPGVELEDEGEEDLADDEEEDDDLEEMDAGYRREMHEADEEDETDETDEMVEISESMLRRELARMRGQRPTRRNRRSSRRVNESRRRAAAARRRRRLMEAEAQDSASSFGGGEVTEELFEVDEQTLINALAEELGDAHKVDQNAFEPEGGAEQMAAHYGGGAAEKLPAGEISERRKLRRQARLAEAKARKAQAELKESNLFNAKLLYVNKLMQQHDLNSKQQRAIVEALDNAKTLREAKLLYNSLTESLRKRKTSGKRLNESKSASGSSSRSLRSAAPAKSGSELSRWAKLAGIK